MLLCYRCHREISTNSAFLELCPYCSSAIHCCQNCLYYDEYSVNKCSESAADWVPDKQKANFCEFFEFTEPAMAKRPMEVDKAKAYWESLWKKAQ
jgi:hypothetical protein